MSVEMEVTDGGTTQEVYDTVDWVKDELSSYVAEQLQETWEQIKALAIELCPKDTGALASSITLESEGGGGGVYAGFQPVQVSGNAGGEGGDFYSNSIFAGDANIINPKTGEPTDLYALFVHDGHAMRGGGFYEGVPFLADAVAFYQDELDSAVDRAMTEMGINSTESDTAGKE